MSFRTLLPLALVSGVALVAAQVGTARTGWACKPSTTPLATSTQTFAARVTTATHAFHKPGKGAFLALPVGDPYGFPTTLSILDRYRGCGGATWYRVRLAHWPNGTTGWVPASAVTTTRLRVKIVVDGPRTSLRSTARVAW